MESKRTTRNKPGKFWLVMACLLPFAACGRDDHPSPGSNAQPPDVVIFLVDTLRADWTGPGGFDQDTTPILNALSKQSVFFEQASSAAPWTLPSVVSLFTGKHVAEHNVIHDRLRMADTTVTFAQLLQEWGYQTHSMHRNPYAGGKWGLKRGFDQSVLSKRQSGEKEVADFLSSISPNPFFLYIHNSEPHDPHHMRKRFMDTFNPVAKEFLKDYGNLVAKYRSSTRKDYAKGTELGSTDNTDEQEKWIAGLNDRREKIENIYSASVRDADSRLGDVIRELVKQGRWDNTLFIMVADHGEELGDHGGWLHDQSAYQELIHVPLMIRFPHDKHGGKRVSAPISLVDVMPTLLDIIDCPLERPEISGRSLLPLIHGQESSDPKMRIVSIRNNMKKYFKPYKEGRGDLNVVVRKGYMKAIFNVEPGTVELYDLKNDPKETKDLAQTHASEAEEFAQFAAQGYAEMLQRADQSSTGDLSQQSADVLEGLRDLGYIGGDESAPLKSK